MGGLGGRDSYLSDWLVCELLECPCQLCFTFASICWEKIHNQEAQDSISNLLRRGSTLDYNGRCVIPPPHIARYCVGVKIT